MRALIITHSITRRDEKSLERYLAEISKYPVLAPEEELALFKRIKDGDELAFNRMVQHNLRFVVSVAKQYQNIGLWLGDLINEGNIGLMMAVRRFDETRGFKFISYAVWWIRQAILQAISEKSRKIRVPLSLHSHSTKLMRTSAEFMQQDGREPTMDELSAETGISVGIIKKTLENRHRCHSLDAPVSEEGDGSLVQMLADEKIPQPDYGFAVRESQQKEVQQLLAILPPRQAHILSLYYGIDRKSPVSLNDISTIMGLSRERIRQIRDKGIMRLRAKARHFAPTLT